MTEAVEIALIASAAPTGAVLVAAWLGHKKVESLAKEVIDIRLHINSRMDQLLELRGAASEAIGRDAGRAEQQTMRADKPCSEYKPWPAHHGEDGQHICWNCSWSKSSHETKKGDVNDQT